MHLIRELLFSSLLSAAWLSICFVFFGVCYSLLGAWIGPGRLLEIEAALGRLEFGEGIYLHRVALVAYGLAMVLACIPMNYYWLRRLRHQEAEAGEL